MSAMDTSGLTSPADVASTEERWRDIRRFTEQSSEFASPHFEPGPENLECIKDCMVLVVGAGGLGCELLKNLSIGLYHAYHAGQNKDGRVFQALSGFTKIHVIDMDTIDLSNLNRQFLFRVGDIGKSKAEIAAKFIEKRVRGCSVTPHNCRIQDQPRSFYAQFSLVICGLDSIVARRWLNDTLCELVETDDDGNVISGVIPLIDGGTEGFKGNARVILPHMTACVECTLDLYPPQENFPLCTIATTPRLPEHCIEYVKVIEWEKFKPFQGTALDADSPEHVEWVYKRASKRADSYGIKGVDLRLTQADCIACGGKKISMSLKPDSKLLFLYDKLVEKYQLKNPTLKSSSCEAPLYMISDMIPQMKEPSEANLDKNIGELVLDGEEILVADEALTKTISLVVHFDLSEQGA